MNTSKWLPIAFIVAFTPAIQAHAVLLESQPASGAVIAGPVVPIALRFNSRVDAKRSRVTLACEGHAERVLVIGDQVTPQLITSSVSDVKPGKCQVRWQVLAADGHITRASYSFQVK